MKKIREVCYVVGVVVAVSLALYVNTTQVADLKEEGGVTCAHKEKTKNCVQ
jgi:hypothetical protein